MAAAITGMVFLTFGMAFFGWRITYAPELENSWSAVSAVAAWVSIVVAIASAVASFSAVWYTIRIADKQNKIDLFKKRYQVYQTVNDCNTFCYSLANIEREINLQDAYIMFLSVFDGTNTMEQMLKDTLFDPQKQSDDRRMEQLEWKVILKCKQVSEKLKETEFLFAGESAVIEYTQTVASQLLSFLVAPSQVDDSSFQAGRMRFTMAVMSESQNEALKKMEQKLLL